jgi:hypothetical protein
VKLRLVVEALVAKKEVAVRRSEFLLCLSLQEERVRQRSLVACMHVKLLFRKTEPFYQTIEHVISFT